MWRRAFVLTGLGVVAVLLAAGGIGGVLVYLVNRRVREIAVRVAVGAGRGAVLRMIYRQGLTLAGWGVLGGLAGAAVGARYLEALLWGTSADEPWVYGGAALLLMAVACAACYFPARLAVRVPLADALRAE